MLSYEPEFKKADSPNRQPTSSDGRMKFWDLGDAEDIPEYPKFEDCAPVADGRMVFEPNFGREANLRNQRQEFQRRVNAYNSKMDFVERGLDKLAKARGIRERR